LNQTIYFCDDCLERRTVDSCGNSTCLKTPQSGFLEEAEAVPAESNGPQRKTNQRICRSLYQLRGLKATNLLGGGVTVVPKLGKLDFHKHFIKHCPSIFDKLKVIVR